jgi:hypothetical protein
MAIRYGEVIPGLTQAAPVRAAQANRAMRSRPRALGREKLAEMDCPFQ